MSNSTNTIALAVAGGGYRATLYSLGALWRLNEFGLLRKLDRITSVSGGSILMAHLALHWNELEFDNRGCATNFKEVVAVPIQQFCSKRIDIQSVLSGLFSFRDTIGDKMAKAYDKRLFHGAGIQSLPSEGPEFIFYGTNYQTGSSLRIQKKEIYDYKIGRYPKPEISIAKAVGISSAFPPALAPVTLKTDSNHWKKINMKGFSEYYDDVRFREKLHLADGGLYDNLGLEAVWKGGYSYVLCCDAGAPFKADHRVKTNWVSQLSRMTGIMTDQQRALRKRILIARYIDKKYGGAYFGISTEIDNYEFDDPMLRDSNATKALQYMRTRLNAFKPAEQGRLINWGYALADTAIRKHAPAMLAPALNVKGNWPVPEYRFE